MLRRIVPATTEATDRAIRRRREPRDRPVGMFPQLPLLMIRSCRLEEERGQLSAPQEVGSSFSAAELMQ